MLTGGVPGCNRLEKRAFCIFSQLANQVPSYELIRPANAESHERIIQLICEELSKLQDG